MEDTPHMLAYVKNHGMPFEVPYHDGGTPRRYRPIISCGWMTDAVWTIRCIWWPR